eukprot:253160-Pleurochrysis_carterae.AAC.1
MTHTRHMTCDETTRPTGFIALPQDQFVLGSSKTLGCAQPPACAWYGFAHLGLEKVPVGWNSAFIFIQ